MDPLIGTGQCPHLGFELKDGRPCCHADDLTRRTCGRYAPNPAARGSGAGDFGVSPYFCTVLGTENIPAEALRLAAQEKARVRQAENPGAPKYRAPSDVTGQTPAAQRPSGDPDFENPVIPTHTLRAANAKPAPNAPCPCNSGKKYKKCCGRFG